MKKYRLHIASLMLATVAVAPANATPFRSHDAVYVMKPLPTHVSTGSTISHAEGVLRYRFRNDCDGWSVENQSVLLMSTEAGNTASVVWEYTSWESKDGKELKFHSRTKRNGRQTEEIDGKAQTIDGKTRLSYRKPAQRTVNLEERAYFPTSHLMKSLALVEAGESFFNARYFDGSGTDDGFDLDLIMMPYKGKPMTTVEDVTLKNVPVWDIQLGFHRPGVETSIPEFEIGARYRKDGVSTKLRQDYGDFILSGDLTELNYIQEPVCD